MNIGEFIEKFHGIFDIRFLVAYWLPVIIGGGSAIHGVLLKTGYADGLDWWFGLDSSRQFSVTIAGFLLTVVLALTLRAFSRPLVRLYAGFSWWTWPRKIGLWIQEKRYERLRKQDRQLASLWKYFPEDNRHLQPTRLGNHLQAADEYALKVYGLDSAVWWPHLVAVFPKTFREQVDNALTPLLALINLATILGLVALGHLLLLPQLTTAIISVLITIGIQLLVVVVCIKAATDQAVSYGDVIRVGFDFYRHDILRQLRIPLPETLAAERDLWPILTHLSLWRVMPWDREESEAQASRPQSRHYPFYYDSLETADKEEPSNLDLRIRVVPQPTMPGRGAESPADDQEPTSTPGRSG
jgi:hypothetical protein